MRHLEELEQLKNDFISNASHELLTPHRRHRRARPGCSSPTPSRVLSDAASSLARSVERNALRLNLLTSDFGGDGAICRAAPSTSIAGGSRWTRLIADAVASMKPLVEERRQTLEVRQAEPLQVLGDRSRLEEVVINLLAHASKYAPESGLLA